MTLHPVYLMVYHLYTHSGNLISIYLGSGREYYFTSPHSKYGNGPMNNGDEHIIEAAGRCRS